LSGLETTTGLTNQSRWWTSRIKLAWSSFLTYLRMKFCHSMDSLRDHSLTCLTLTQIFSLCSITSLGILAHTWSGGAGPPWLPSGTLGSLALGFRVAAWMPRLPSATSCPLVLGFKAMVRRSKAGGPHLAPCLLSQQGT
jgi:hypothetical protein